MQIRFLPYQPHCFAFGGFEIQMLSAFEAVKSCGIDVVKMDVWSRDGDFDILHCWGLDLANYENVKWAKKSGKKVVMTALIGYYETFLEELKFNISSFFYKERLVKEMVRYIDSFIVLNDLQAAVLIKHYGIDEHKIDIIPNIVDQRFYEMDTSDEKVPKYALTVGNVCNRKNQVNLAQACVNQGLDLVIVGKLIEGEEKYGDLLERIIDNKPGIRWIKGLPENSTELIRYYKNCHVFALPSFIEQQPISLLEAAVMNKPLLIANKAYGRQKYYMNSCLVNPDSVTSISKGLKNILNNYSRYLPDQKQLEDCKSKNVGAAYRTVYEKLF